MDEVMGYSNSIRPMNEEVVKELVYDTVTVQEEWLGWRHPFLKRRRLYNKAGTLIRESTFNILRGNYHCEDGPALTRYFDDGAVKEVIWYYKGEVHRDECKGPAHVIYDEKGRVLIKRWVRNGSNVYSFSVTYSEDGSNYTEWWNSASKMLLSYWRTPEGKVSEFKEF